MLRICHLCDLYYEEKSGHTAKDCEERLLKRVSSLREVLASAERSRELASLRRQKESG